MNILIPYSWLSEYLDTNASAKKIAECLTLCGPTVKRIEKAGNDYIYEIEVTTNRVDAMSIYGIAREAAVILPQFGIKARLKPLRISGVNNKNNLGIRIVNNPKLCHRILAIKLENVNLTQSPKWMREKLEKVGQRPLINAIDITNYVMWEIGHPTHAFDYDRISENEIIVREAKKGEILTTLDNKKLTLKGGEVIFDNGKGEIIDLPGIMGTKNTVVTKRTKNVLLWIESVDPKRIRKASMGLRIRSQAAVLNEKSVDPELGEQAILRGVELFKDVTGAKVGSRLIDIYPTKYKPKSIKTNLDFINKRLGVNVTKAKVRSILNSLGFEAIWSGNYITVSPPSYRAKDVSIPEDIVEEIARIYGYHNLPSQLMTGDIPDPIPDTPFQFEYKVKNSLKGLGGSEVYTSSLVSKDHIKESALKLSNPLGKDSEYLRDSLMPSLIDSVTTNKSITEPYHLFELSNVFLPRKHKLPEEIMTLAGIFVNYKYRDAKGVIESLLDSLNIVVEFKPEDKNGYITGRRVVVICGKTKIGSMGVLESGYIYYEFEVETLRAVHKSLMSYVPIPKYPPQIEDITLNIPNKTKINDLLSAIADSNKYIVHSELTDTYKSSYTFRVWFQHPKKTLTDKEVEQIRNAMLKRIERKFGATQKK